MATVYLNAMIKNRRWRLALKVCSDIVAKLPVKGDNPLAVLVKFASIVDSVQKVMHPEAGALHKFTEEHGLEQKSSEQFVSLFFSTALRSHFKLRRLALTEGQDLVEAAHDTLGTLYFTEYTYSSEPSPSEEFFHTPNFNFQRVLEQLWGLYEGRVQTATTTGKYGYGRKTTFTQFSPPDVLYGKQKAVLDALVARHRQYARDKVSRTYLLVGNPGTGKTSFAVRFAEALGCRTLMMDALSLNHLPEQDVIFMLEGLAPDFLFIDDIDKAGIDKALPTLLSLMTHIKKKHPEICIILAANNAKKLDTSFRRSGRVDKKVKFELPCDEEQAVIFKNYLSDFKVAPLSPADFQTITEATKKLPGADLREVALQLRYAPLEEVLELVADMQELAQEVELAKTDGVPTGDVTLKAG